MTRFNCNTDHRTQFETEVTALIERNIEDRTERMTAVKALTDEYINLTGERPDPQQLERLTDYVLREELTSKLKNKSTVTEYPFLSDRQLRSRRSEECSINMASEYGSDSRNYEKPIRRKRNQYENNTVDRKAKSRNAERRKRYREAKKSSEVVTYNINENDGDSVN